MASPPAELLSDDVKEEILLRLPDPADLVRTSASCVSYRRLATDRVFLRRFRARHPAPLLGFLDHNGFFLVLPPHASASAARAISLAADFSFSFIPSPAAGRWVVRDVRDGRVLLDRAPKCGGVELPVFTDIAVCDPLHRRCVLLPPIPDDLAATVEHPLRVEFDCWCEAFIIPRGDDGEATSFEVLWVAQCKDKLIVLAFSSVTGLWRAVASLLWRDLISDAKSGAALSHVIQFRQYARGCFFWVMGRDKLLELDITRMDFSTSRLPLYYCSRRIVIVDAGEGRVGMFAIRDHSADRAHLQFRVRQDDSMQWQVEKVILLDPDFVHYIREARETSLLLLSFPRHITSYEEGADLACYSLNVRTMQFEKLCVTWSVAYYMPAHIATFRRHYPHRAYKCGVPGVS